MGRKRVSNIKKMELIEATNNLQSLSTFLTSRAQNKKEEMKQLLSTINNIEESMHEFLLDACGSHAYHYWLQIGRFNQKVEISWKMILFFDYSGFYTIKIDRIFKSRYQKLIKVIFVSN